MKTLALAIAGLLAAPLALANCDTQLERIEQRVKDAGMDPQNEQVLVDWLAQQRAEHQATQAAQCTALAAEIERQMEQKGYFAASAALEGAVAPAYAGAEPGAPQGDEVSIAAAPAEVRVRQPAAQVDVQQTPAEVEVEMDPAQVLVEVPEPRVTVTQPPPQVTVHQPDPKVRVEQQDPQVSVDQAEPEVTVSQGEPQVQVEQGEPQVAVEQSDPIVDVESGDPELEVQQADGGNVAIGASSSAALAGTGADADEAGADDAMVDSDAIASSEPQADSAPEAIWAREEARNGLAAQAGGFGQDMANARQVAVSELVGDIVVDAGGMRVGRVVEALTGSSGEGVFLRVDVAATSDLGSEELVLSVDELEADHSGQLRVAGDSAQVLAAAADRSAEGMHPADGETAQLAGEWE